MQVKNQFTNVGFQANDMMNNVKMAQQMQNMNNVMGKVNNMVDPNAIAKTAQEMQMNLGKMDVMQEMMGDAMDMGNDYDVDDDPNIDAMIGDIEDQIYGYGKNKQGGTQLHNGEVELNDDDIKKILNM